MDFYNIIGYVKFFFPLQGSLLSVLRQFARLKSDKQTISVGFVGYPNVGKSSVINTLRTKNVISVIMTKKIAWYKCSHVYISFLLATNVLFICDKSVKRKKYFVLYHGFMLQLCKDRNIYHFPPKSKPGWTLYEAPTNIWSGQ